MHYGRYKTHGTIYYQTAYDSRPAIIDRDIAKIPLGFKTGKFAIVDKEDAWVDKYNWSCNKDGYVVSRVEKKMVRLHRYLLQTPRSKFTDHKDGNPLNNRRSNIRICTPAQNNYNAKLASSNTTGYKGVSFRPDKKRYIVRVGKTYLGLFESITDAAKAYNKQALIQYGEYARLNEIVE